MPHEPRILRGTRTNCWLSHLVMCHVELLPRAQREMKYAAVYQPGYGTHMQITFEHFKRVTIRHISRRAPEHLERHTGFKHSEM